MQQYLNVDQLRAARILHYGATHARRDNEEFHTPQEYVPFRGQTQFLSIGASSTTTSDFVGVASRFSDDFDSFDDVVDLTGTSITVDDVETALQQNAAAAAADQGELVEQVESGDGNTETEPQVEPQVERSEHVEENAEVEHVDENPVRAPMRTGYNVVLIPMAHEADPREHLAAKIVKNVNNMVDMVQFLQSAEATLDNCKFTSAYAAQARGYASEFMMLSRVLREQLESMASKDSSFLEVDALLSLSEAQCFESHATFTQFKKQTSKFLENELPEVLFPDIDHNADVEKVNDIDRNLFKRLRLSGKQVKFAAPKVAAAAVAAAAKVVPKAGIKRKGTARVPQPNNEVVHEW